jgi:hypothetical protein
MNPIARIIKSRRTRVDANIDAFLARMAEPLPPTWATDWHIGDRVKLCRPHLRDEVCIGAHGTIMAIEPIGPQVIICRPLFVRWSFVDVREWVHPNDLQLIRKGIGVCAADALLTLSNQSFNAAFLGVSNHEQFE